MRDRPSLERTLQAGATDEDVQRLARELLPRTLEIADEVTRFVLETVPDVAPNGDAEGVVVVRESTEQNIGAILAMLAFGVVPGSIEPPLGTLKLLHQTVAGGGDVTTILRGYRAGHAGVWRIWADHVARNIDDAARLHRVLSYSSERLFTHMDLAAEQLVVRYRQEVPSALTAGDRPTRRRLVERLLEGEPVDVDQAAASLGYGLGGHHLGVVMAPLQAGAEPRAALDALAAAYGTANVLALPQGDGTLWAWLGSLTAPRDEVVGALGAVVLDGVLAGVGEPGLGRDGFRRTHEQAREAERLGRMTPEPAAGVVRQRDIELVALLCGDAERARRLAADRLGRLASRDESGERLRETVRVFLACGRSKARAAERLFIHQKTVAYRLARAEELLGRPVAEAGAELEAALLIDLTLHGP